MLRQKGRGPVFDSSTPKTEPIHRRRTRPSQRGSELVIDVTDLLDRVGESIETSTDPAQKRELRKARRSLLKAQRQLNAASRG